MVQKYALANLIEEFMNRNGISVKYVAANPASYTYLDSQRVTQLPVPVCGTICEGSATFFSTSYEFSILSMDQLASCGSYNSYNYGLENLNKYMSRVGKSKLIQQFALRNVTYLLGANDTCNAVFNCGCRDSTIETGCEPLLQGLCRYQRGWIFYHYLQYFYQKVASSEFVHKAISIPGMGHSGCGMLTSQDAKLK